MKIEYAGLKPIISEHGISFKDGKEDKFKYLKYAIDILIAINHEYNQKQKYSHNLQEKRLNPNEILNTLKKFHPEIEDTMEKEISSYILYLDNEEDEVKNRVNLNEVEKDVYLNNLVLMREYRMQRKKNKIFYMHCIDTIVETIIKNKIKEIDTPFSERFWHILQTIEGHLSSKKISSTLKTINNGTLKAQLDVNIY